MTKVQDNKGSDRPAPRQARNYHLNIRLDRPLAWLAAGVRDFGDSPIISLAYGFLVFVISIVIVGGVFLFDLANFLLPCLAGFLVVGPILATGLYQKSMSHSDGKPISMSSVMYVRPGARVQILLVGVMLLLLAILWLRSAFLLYALMYGLLPFVGFEQTLAALFTTPRGLTLLGVGGAVGGLFAAFSFSISVFSIPMLLDQKIDAFTAMGTSMAIAWNNMGLMLVWGALIIGCFVFALLTGLMGLIVVFPVLGHATWHAYQDCRVVIAE